MISQTDIKFAQRLRGFRLQRDLKQDTAAKLLGLKNQQTYSKLENGQLEFTDEIIKSVCEGFSITIEEFTNESKFISLHNSPNANFHSPNSFNNDFSLITELLKTKDDLILSLKEQIATLKGQ